MNPKYQFQQYMPLTALLLAAALGGCGGGGGLGDGASPRSMGDIVGAPLSDPPPAAPGMGVHEPVQRATTLAAAAPPEGEETVGVWVRDDTEPALAADSDAPHSDAPGSDTVAAPSTPHVQPAEANPTTSPAAAEAVT